MPLTIADEDLRAMGLDEANARIEIAARLFDAGKLSFGHAATLAQISETQLDGELRQRDIPRYRYTKEHFEQDVETLDRLSRLREKAEEPDMAV